MPEPDPSKYDIVLLACRPVIITDEYPPNVPVPEPHPGSVITDCSQCSCQVYLGPAQQDARRRLGHKAVAVCFMCASKLSGNNLGSTEVHALTGKVVPTRPYRDVRREQN